MTTLQDDHVVLLEKTLKSNERLVKENDEFREELRSRERAQNEVLRDLMSKIQLEDSPRYTNRKRKGSSTQDRNLDVPPACRRSTRKCYKTLLNKEDFNGFFLDESFESQNNNEIMGRVRDAVLHYNGGENCSWSVAHIEAAIKRYFLSCYETKKKNQDGKYELHKQTCRRQGRVREKLTRRTLALEMVNWPKEVKGKMAEVLTEDYMSSEESECEENADGEITVSAYAVKDLTWESEKLKRRKAKLDKAFKKSQSPRSQKRTIKRIRKDDFWSSRKCPQDAPHWVVRSDQH